MKKYKYKIGQEVYLWGNSYADEQWVKVTKRLMKDTLPFYLLTNFLNKISIPISEDDIHDVPREYGDVCSTNGCEIVDSFLDRSQEDVINERFEELNKEIIQKQNTLIELERFKENITNELNLLLNTKQILERGVEEDMEGLIQLVNFLQDTSI